MGKQMVSFIFPVFNESETIPQLHKVAWEMLHKVEKKYAVEVIFVNDGSKDDSLEKLVKIQKNDDRVKVIDFARNFGHQIAISAGLDYANGDAVIIMDSDLQDPPEVCLQLIGKWEQGFEIVHAKRHSRKDTFFKKLTAYIFYRVLRKLANIDIPEDTGDFRLMDSKVVEVIRKYRERNRFMRGLVASLGFKQTIVLFDRADRFAGTTHYPFRKMVKLAMDAITSFSTTPLQFLTQLGSLFFVLGFLGIFLIGYLLLADMSVIVSVVITTGLFVTGINLLALGIVGMYVGRIYAEVQNRPLYIVSKIYD